MENFTSSVTEAQTISICHFFQPLIIKVYYCFTRIRSHSTLKSKYEYLKQLGLIWLKKGIFRTTLL